MVILKGHFIYSTPVQRSHSELSPQRSPGVNKKVQLSPEPQTLPERTDLSLDQESQHSIIYHCKGNSKAHLT